LKITDDDRNYYSSAVDFLSEKLEIAQEFVRHDGLTSVPVEQVGDLMITGIKEWVMSAAGENWLGTIGYYKETGLICASGSIATSIVVSGTGLSLCYDTCTVCSGHSMDGFSLRCERCGHSICKSCSNVVDDYYGGVWCKDCLEAENLTNMLDSTL
jgi:hypothetical protein